MTEEDPGIRMLETQVDLATRWGRRAMRELHQQMLADLIAAQQRARRAELRLAKARRRARRAEAELARIRGSWAQRALSSAAALPPRLRHIARRGSS